MSHPGFVIVGLILSMSVILSASPVAEITHTNAKPSEFKPNCVVDGVPRSNGDIFARGCKDCRCAWGGVSCWEDLSKCPVNPVAEGCKDVENPNRNDGTKNNCCPVVVCETTASR